MRLRLFEFNDLPWLPEFLRAAMTRYLVAAYLTLPAPKQWAKLIAQALDRQGTDAIVDLCSGHGGPLELVRNELAVLGKTSVQITRTDLFPMPGVIAADARHVPRNLDGVRTMFAAFHHFRPSDAKAILRDARENGKCICIFEPTRRAPLPLILITLTPLFVLFLTLRVRPLRWSQVVFTYLIPILPLLIAFDGIVSTLRTYTVGELREMTADLSGPDYEWEALDIQMPGLPFPFPALLGRPARSTATTTRASSS